jgi:hypothetical protein
MEDIIDRKPKAWRQELIDALNAMKSTDQFPGCIYLSPSPDSPPPECNIVVKFNLPWVE